MLMLFGSGHLNCAPFKTLAPSPMHVQYQQFPLCFDSLSEMKAFGDITFSDEQTGKSHGSIFIRRAFDGRLSAEVYNALAAAILTLQAFGDSVRIVCNDSVYQYALNDSATNLPSGYSFPIIFRDLIRILCGQPLWCTLFFGQPDSVVEEKSNKLKMVWLYNEYTVSALYREGQTTPHSLTYSLQRNGGLESLSFSVFYKRMFKRIYFQQSPRNYFSLEYKEIDL